jgi:hypothetical protein
MNNNGPNLSMTLPCLPALCSGLMVEINRACGKNIQESKERGKIMILVDNR